MKKPRAFLPTRIAVTESRGTIAVRYGVQILFPDAWLELQRASTSCLVSTPFLGFAFVDEASTAADNPLKPSGNQQQSTRFPESILATPDPVNRALRHFLFPMS
ncbi:hypothetical protein GQ602_002809 [Ophiocordyceps camponoti-floridani]|uniref:Uncharacterized protein n=1 Tax=Ophiocordyceps camponoti-floridani TaxID=2030778 RepID=A0A8H4VFL8_9HYPO|nr:hypothetical protein GQ602_002809 [Ophiocordyceps camponoti-floridani]